LLICAIGQARIVDFFNLFFSLPLFIFNNLITTRTKKNLQWKSLYATRSFFSKCLCWN